MTLGERKSKTGLILPLYSYPGSSWTAIVEMKLAHRTVPFLAIINPGTGPGNVRDPNYVAGVEKLKSAGITVLGYVYTRYGARKESEIIADIDSYQNWYPIEGMMFDEMSLSQDLVEYYLSILSHARSASFELSVGNPGKRVPEEYPEVMDLLNVYEDSGMPKNLLAREARFRGREKLSMIAYAVQDLNFSFLKEISRSVSMLYLTDADFPNPYDKLPSFFSRLVEMLEKLN